MTDDYVTVNCIKLCPKCKHKKRFEHFGTSARYGYDMFELDCDYIKSVILNPFTECNGMFEPRHPIYDYIDKGFEAYRKQSERK